MKLVRTLQIGTWDSRTAEQAVEYLKSRGFQDARAATAASGLTVAGTRGSWRGNLTSFDMTKLRARIRLSTTTAGQVTVELDVNTFGQQITEWNKATWRLELAELRRMLLGQGRIDTVWERFAQDRRAASLRWTFTFMVGGQRLPERWETEIQELEKDGAA